MTFDKALYIIGLIVFLSACKDSSWNSTINSLSKLEQLYCVRPDSVMDCYDLSGDSLTAFPDLSRYVIRSLDLSHNQLDTFVPQYLPTGLEKLNLSYNRLEGRLEIGEKDIPTLEELDVSHNSLLEFICEKELHRLVLAHNMLDYNVRVWVSQYLDVSYNTYFCPHVIFDSSYTDTIVSEGLADKEPLRCLACLPGVIDKKRLNASRQLSVTAKTYIKYYMDSPDSLRKAIRLLDASIRARDNYDAKEGKALVLALLGEKKAALEIMNRTGSTAYTCLSKGIAFELNGQKEKALQLYKKAYDDRKLTMTFYRKPIELARPGWVWHFSECMAAFFLMDNRRYNAEKSWKKVYGSQAVIPDAVRYCREVSDLFVNMDETYRTKSREEYLLILWKNRFLIEW